MRASVLIVDDHAGFRAQARRLLDFEGYRVVGKTADSVSAIEGARAARGVVPRAELSREAIGEPLR